MNAPTADRLSFSRLVRALKPYLGESVFVGGWAHSLHSLHALARPTGFQPLMTEDADVALPTGLKSSADSIAALLKREGFTETFHGDDVPPVSEYTLGEDTAGFYVEFLAPLLGGGYRRDGRRDATVTLAGVTAQKLRHVDLLVIEPWQVRLSQDSGFAIDAPGVEVQIANAVTYLAQKLLVLPHHNTLRKLHARRVELFAEVTDLTRQAAIIAAATSRPNPPPADRLAAVCRSGLEQIFG